MRADLSGLTALLCVAEKRSFTAAAADLGITPSAVSQTVRALEDRVGVRLLQRTTRSVGLTEAGARFIARLKPALDGVEEAFESLGELRDRPGGVLRLTLPRLGYEQVLAPKLAAFVAKYPDIELDLSIDEAFTDIVAEGFDAGIRIGEMVEREMIGVRVSGDLRVAVVGSPGYFAKHEKPKHPRDLHTASGTGVARSGASIAGSSPTMAKTSKSPSAAGCC
jgi:DNA-binding transcriptional LysR family regulator